LAFRRIWELTPNGTAIGEANLTVIARAFHWMDKGQVLKDLFTITKPGGGVAIIADTELRAGRKLPWKEIIDQVIRRWLGEKRKAGTDGTYSHPTIRFDEYLEESAFRDLEIATIQSERIWTIDQIVGYLYSTSYSSLPVLGDKKEPFEAEIRTCLKELEPSGKFRDPVTTEIMMVWKSGS
jgi:hypothetical protein